VKASGGTIELIGKEWNHDPLKVYIQASPPFQTYVSDVLTALNDWSSALESGSGNTVDSSEIGVGSADGIFDFVIVDSQRDADIVIHIRGGAYAGVLGITIFQDVDRDGYFDKVRITVKVGPGATSEDFRNVVRHEIGHALGLGHNNDPSDLMYPTYDASKTDVDVKPSALDLDALLLIYYLDGFGLPNRSPGEIPPSYSE
jgi:predicted Zn-dependent protease